MPPVEIPKPTAAIPAVDNSALMAGSEHDGPRTQWSSGLCACMTDWCTCCTACWCVPTTTAQLYERFHSAKGSCMKVGLLLWVLYILYVFLNMMTQEMVMNGYFAYFPELMKWVEWEREHGVPGVYNASHPQPSIYEYYPPGTQAVQAGMGIVGIAFFLLTCVLTCQLRAMVRQRDQIKPSTCGGGFGPGFDDCCCACCCMCCVQAQMLRHEGMSGANYQVCSATGTAAV